MNTGVRKRGILTVRADAGDSAALKKILAELTKTFEDFKTANDERLDAMAKGKADVVIDEKVERVNNALTDISAKMDAAQKRADEAAAAADEALKLYGTIAVGGTGEGGEAQAALLNSARVFMASRTGKALDQIGEVDVEAYAKYRASFSTFLRRGGADGERLPQEVQAALQSGSDGSGGFFSPAEMASRVQKRMFETSAIRAVATVESTTTDTWELPLDTDEAESGGWVSERGSRSDSDSPRTGIQTISLHELYAQPKATQRILEDANRDVEGWLADKIADKLSRVENAAFVTGNGVGKPRGIFSYGSAAVLTDDATRAWGVLQYVLSGAAGGFPTLSGIPGAADADPLITMVSKLKPEYRANARWMMNRGSEATIRKMKDGDGRYIVGLGDIKDGASGFNLFGYPIAPAEDVADMASDSYSIGFGDFRAGYTIVDRLGIRVLRDPYTGKPFVKFYTTKRVGGDVTDFDAIKLMKMAAS